MNYQDQGLCRVRTVTTFISLTRDKILWPEEIMKAALFCAQATQALQQRGYDVQSVRVVTNAFGEYLDTSSLQSAQQDMQQLQQLLTHLDTGGVRLRFAIGEAKTANEIAILPELIQQFGDLCNVCVNVAADELGLFDDECIQQCAESVIRISELTERGEGNFNFTVNFNCKPLIPYFPASYHQSSLGRQYVIGLETPDLLLAVLQQYNQRPQGNYQQQMQGRYDVMRQALQYHVDAIHGCLLGAQLDSDFHCAGFDSSAAPSKNCASMASLYEQLGVEYFGAAGSVEASALLTRVFKSISGVDLVGFSGLMLALTEDLGLAQGSIAEHFDIRALLSYSAVCGIGLDTVPIPGNTSADKIAALMRDTGTLAFRLNKPLTVRVFPVPGLTAGDMTQFSSDDLCNCAVLAVP